MTVTLINATRRMKVINLPHEIYCAARGSCACVAAPGRGKRLFASSLTLPAGTAARGLDEAVLLVPEVARDLRTGELRVRREPPPQRSISRTRSGPRRTGRRKAR